MIEIDGLTKRYGDKTAVDRLSFVVEPGVVTGFLGPNGAGRPLRAPLALALALAAPATSRLPALTTGLRGTGTAISFPHGFVTALTGGTP